VVSSTGSAADLHGRPIPDEVDRLVWSHRVDGPALVLGSTQPDDVVNRDASDMVEIVRRRSGGGAVLVQTYDTWLDVLIGRRDRLWDDDVGKAFAWVGQVWQRALAALGVDCSVHSGRLQNREAGRVVCFAGIGPGEIIDAEGIKVLGLSQRRTRDVARFQCLVPYLSPLSHTTDLLDPSAVPSGFNHDATIGVAIDPSVVTTAFLAELARLD
jgi:lipoate-protein ligase A